VTLYQSRTRDAQQSGADIQTDALAAQDRPEPRRALINVMTLSYLYQKNDRAGLISNFLFYQIWKSDKDV